MTSKPRRDAGAIWTAGVDAVRARPLVYRQTRIEADDFWVGEDAWIGHAFDRVLVVGAGKAGTAMTQGLIDAIGDWRPVHGWVNVPEGTQGTQGTAGRIAEVVLHPARPAGRNEPTADGVAGTQSILRLVESARPRDLCIALISGGGSALMPAPTAGVSLDDKLAVTRFLSGAGADIVELNTVRKHLSDVKGGGLLRACRAGALVTLVLSDVLGDPLDLIASGPTVPDPSTPHDALAVLQTFDPDRRLPESIYEVLQHRQTEPAQTKRATTEADTIVIGNNALAVDEAGIVAERLGYNHVMQSATRCEGLAEDVGRRMADMVVDMLRSDPKAHRVDCLITGGEPVVQLAAPEIRGRGGRNQQLVLAAYERLLDRGLSDAEWDRVCILSGGTDGEDGPTDAAGAILDASVHREATRRGLGVQDSLHRNDAYSFFQAAGGLLMTGPTGTNVCDVRVALVRPV